MKIVFTFFALLISLYTSAHDSNLYQISFGQKVDSSEFIFTGKVIDQNSLWNDDNSLIITLSRIVIEKEYKGLTENDTITIRTFGGRVGNYEVTTSSLLKLDVGDIGLFFCNSTHFKDYFSVYASSQGFIRFYQDIAYCPFYKSSIDDLKLSLEQNLGIPSVTQSQSATIKSASTITTLSSNITFSPSSLSSGTNSLIYISGSGFGTQGPNVNDYVSFSDADNGVSFGYYTAPDYEYQSWTDTLIILEVPTQAGSGPIKVTVGANQVISTSNLTVNYSILNVGDGEIPKHQNLNGFGGMDWTLSNNLINNGDSAIYRALNTWKCATNIPWSLSSNNTNITTPNAGDGVNILSYGTTPAGVLGVCYNFYFSCDNGLNWAITGQDIIFNNTTSWYHDIGIPNNWERDLESVSLHELGHAHSQGHVIETSNVMYYAISGGMTSRILHYYNVVGGNFIVDLSSLPHPCVSSPIIEDNTGNCTSIAYSDISLSAPNDSLHSQTCIDQHDVKVNVNNLGLDTITSAQFHWSINNSIQPPYNWTGVLTNQNSLIDFILGSYNFQDSTYNVMIWAEQVNGGNELNQLNDTLNFTFTPIPCVPDNAGIANLVEIDEYDCINSSDIIVDLFNPGTNILNNCWLNYSANGVEMDSIFWSGSLLPGDTIFNIVIGNYNGFSSPTLIETKLKLPNGVIDNYSQNDTLSFEHSPKRLNGNYSIGGISPDYLTINDAIYDLNNFGVCGNVTLNIRSGVYEEVLYFDSIPSNGNYEITIQSEVNHRDSVLIIFPGNTPGFYNLINIDSTRNLNFNNLSLNFDNGSAHEDLVYIENGAKNIRFNNIFFDLKETSRIDYNTSKEAIEIQAKTGDRTVDYITIENSRFEYGSTAIRYMGGLESNNNPVGLILKNNEFHYQERSILFLYNVENLLVCDNLLESYNSDHIQVEVISSSDSLTFKRNRFVYSGDEEIIFFDDCISDSIPIRIYNNSFYQEDDQVNNQLIYMNQSGLVEVINNTFTQFSSNSSSSGQILVIGTSDSLTIINNIFNHNFNGLLLSLNNSSSSIYSDHNVFYTTGLLFSSIGAVYSNSLLTHQANTGQDLNSMEANPLVLGPIHQIPTNHSFNNLAQPLGFIQTDIDGFVRDSFMPDIGAFEFSHHQFDLGVTGATSSDSVLCSDELGSIYVDLLNFGQSPIDSFQIVVALNQVEIDTVSFSQNIAPNQSINLFLGDFQLPDSLINEVTLTALIPNYIDSNQYNNSFNFNILTKLNGIYTLGNDTCDFTLINEAIDHLNYTGICGPTVFKIADGIYTSSAIEQCIINEIDGSTEINTITIESASLDSTAVEFDVNFNCFILNNTKYINFHQLSFTRPIVENLYAIMMHSVSNVNISNCHFERVHLGNNPFGQNVPTDSVNITNNYFYRGRISFAEGNSFITNLNIEENVFKTHSGIDISGVKNLHVHHNDFESHTTSLTSLKIDNCRNFTIEKNYFPNMGYALIFINNNNYPGERSLFVNNFVRCREQLIYCSNNDSLEIVNNSFYQYTDDYPSLNFYGLYFHQNTNMVFVNNIVYSEFYGNTLIFHNASDINEFYPSNNIYFKSQDSLVRIGDLNGTYHSFYEWQNSFNKDSGSYYTFIDFNSPTDLHLTNFAPADANGLSINAISDDIDGDARVPGLFDIGADQFDLDWSIINDIIGVSITSPINNDCGTADSVHFTFTNMIGDTLFLANIQLIVNSVLINNTIWNDTLINGQSINVFVGSFNFIPGQSYNIEVRIDNPNNSIDLNPINNSILLNYSSIPPTTILLASDSLCPGGTLQLSSSINSPGTIYNWSDNSQDSVLLISSGGVYSLEIEDTNGCLSSDTVTIIEHLAPTQVSITYLDTVFCEGNDITLTAQPQLPGATYQWNWTGASVPSITVNQSIEVTLTTLDSNLCQTMDTISVYEMPYAGSGFNLQQDSLLTAFVQVGVDYQWLYNGSPIIGANSSVLDAELAGDYQLITTTAYGCSDTSNIFSYAGNVAGIESIVLSEISIYPNIVEDHIIIKGTTEPLNYSIVDLTGSIVQQKTNFKENEIILDKISNGSYLLKIEHRKNTHTFKFIVVNN